MSKTLPQAQSSYAQPFELMTACHERVDRSLTLLKRLCAHAQEHGVDQAALDAARDVMRYFDIAAPLHHQDEELHVFPLLDAEPRWQALCERLRAQHELIDTQWAAIKVLLTRIDTLTPEQMQELARLAEGFVQLHEEHVRDENEFAFPVALERLTPEQLQAMGREMAARRGLELS